MITRLTALCATLLLCACGDGQPGPDGIRPSAAIRSAIGHPDRLETDRQADAGRQPGVVLEFFGIAPGMTVLDLFSGSGYYTELLYRIVGPEGAVWAHNNSPYLQDVEALAARYAGNRLDGVRRFTAENNELSLPPASFDAVLMALTYHDIYFVDESIGWPKIDGPRLLAELFQAMKPGAVLGVIDHMAAPGAPADSGDTLHRIDASLARREIEAAGFVFEAQNSALRNPGDELTLSVFDPAIRGRTDRFVYRFRRP